MRESDYEEAREKKSYIMWISIIILTIIGVIIGAMAFYPRYRVWSQEMEGRAEFAKAEQNRRIKIEEAKANLEAEKLNAEAEVERAIEIENGSLSEKYIQYLRVRQQNQINDKTVIYILTEANLPILEAGKHR